MKQMIKPITIFILDDEEEFCSKLSLQIENYFSQKSLLVNVSAFTEKRTVLEALSIYTPDLFIADINLKSDMENGIDIALELKKQVSSCEVIYLTAYLSYATDIYETEPLYFVLKEQIDEQLVRALNFFIRKSEEKQKHIQVYVNRELTTIRIETILFCEHVGKHTNIVCKDEKYEILITMKKLMDMLPEAVFSYSHSGFIVNLAYVKSYTRTSVNLMDGRVIPMGRSHLKKFRIAYLRYIGNRI